MQNTLITLYDFPAGWALAMFVGFNLFVVFVINLLIVMIEAVILKAMHYGSWLSSLGTSFFMNVISASAGFLTGYIVTMILGIKEFVLVMAYLPSFILEPVFMFHPLYLLLFLFICYIVTIALEFPVLYIFNRVNTFHQVGKWVLVTNLFSYLFLLAILVLAKAYFSSSAR